MKTLTFVAGAAIGYVFGTKAGREKYQQLVEGARAFSEKPAVQQAQSKVKDMVGQGTSAVASKMGMTTDDPTTPVTTTPGTTTPVTTPGTTKKATATTAGSLNDNAF